MEPLKIKNFNIGRYKAGFYESIRRTITIKESRDNSFDIIEIGFIDYNKTKIVLTVMKDCEENIVPVIGQTQMPNKEFIIFFDCETYKRLDEQIFRHYIAHELGHTICAINGEIYPDQTIEEKINEVNQGKVNENEHAADREALKIMQNKNTYIKALEYLIERLNIFIKDNLKDSDYEQIIKESIEIRIKVIKNPPPLNCTCIY